MECTQVLRQNVSKSRSKKERRSHTKQNQKKRETNKRSNHKRTLAKRPPRGNRSVHFDERSTLCCGTAGRGHYSCTIHQKTPTDFFSHFNTHTGRAYQKAHSVVTQRYFPQWPGNPRRISPEMDIYRGRGVALWFGLRVGIQIRRPWFRFPGWALGRVNNRFAVTPSPTLVQT